MGRLGDLIECTAGIQLSRVTKKQDRDAKIYDVYSQAELVEDMAGAVVENIESKKIQTSEHIDQLHEGDIVFGLMTGNSAIVSKAHDNYYYPNNYIKIIPGANIDSKFLVYMLNEDKDIKKQLIMGVQGSNVLKYTVNQIRELEIPQLPSLTKQKAIGDIYSKQLTIESLKKHVAHLETILQLHVLEEERKK